MALSMFVINEDLHIIAQFDEPNQPAKPKELRAKLEELLNIHKDQIHRWANDPSAASHLQLNDQENAVVFDFISSVESDSRYFNVSANKEIKRAVGQIEPVDLATNNEAQRKLSRANTRLQTVISNFNAGILLESEDRKIIFTNKTFCQLFEIPVDPKLLIGQDCSNAAEQSKHLMQNSEVFVTHIKELLKKRSARFDEEVHMQNGKVLLRDFIPIWEGSIYLGHLWVYKDISQQKQRELELHLQKKREDEAKIRKERFLSSLSRELKTPLNDIKRLTQQVVNKQTNEAVNPQLKQIEEAISHLSHVANDLFDVSSIEEGLLKLDIKSVYIDEIVSGVFDYVKPHFDRKNLSVNVEGLALFDSPKLTDPVRLRQILLNLLLNACKFTDYGGATLRFEQIEKTNDIHYVCIHVEDTGTGIPKEDISHLFEAFNHQPEDGNSKYYRSGLDLYLVKQLVERLGGLISVKSTLNKGTRFTIDLPLLIDKEAKIKQDTPAIHQDHDINTLEGYSILVTEDNETNFTLVQQQLLLWGLKVDWAKNGKECLQKLEQHSYDLIIMDMMMPVMDGLETTKEIRALNPPLNSIPIVAMTAAVLAEEREHCLNAGMNEYLTKPFLPKDLFKTLEHYLRPSNTQKTTPAEEQATVEQTEATFKPDQQQLQAPIDTSYLHDISGGNADFIQSMLERFEQEIPELIDKMQTQFTQKNAASLKNTVHQTKSICSYLKEEELKTILQTIENKVGTDQLDEQIQFMLEEAFQGLKQLHSRLQLRN